MSTGILSYTRLGGAGTDAGPGAINDRNRNKVYRLDFGALSGLASGATLMVAGSGGEHVPEALLRVALCMDLVGLTVICQDDHEFAGAPGSESVRHGEFIAVPDLVAAGMVSRIIGSNLLQYESPDLGPSKVAEVYRLRKDQDFGVESVPAGILAERIRAGGAGLGGVFLPETATTRLNKGPKARQIEPCQIETRQINGRTHVFHPPLTADFALLRAHAADTMGNLVYQGTQRNWNPVMATAAATVVAEVDEIVEPGELDPELIITPGIFVDRIVKRGQRQDWPQFQVAATNLYPYPAESDAADGAEESDGT